jgi:HTH-type transcriptional regulator / antitoxin HigA
MPKTATIKVSSLPKTFEELCSMHWPRPIHDDLELDNAQEIVDRLAVLPKLTQGQEDYLQTLSTLIESYEDEHFAIDTRNLDPIDTLQYLMQDRGMSPSDLGRLLGERSLGSKILGRQRDLSKAHILKLARHFADDASTFLRDA